MPNCWLWHTVMVAGATVRVLRLSSILDECCFHRLPYFLEYQQILNRPIRHDGGMTFRNISDSHTSDLYSGVLTR